MDLRCPAFILCCYLMIVLLFLFLSSIVSLYDNRLSVSKCCFEPFFMLQSVVSSETETVLSPIIVVWHVVHKNPVLGKPEMSVMTKKNGWYLCISNVYR